jgi:phage I-like protein
MDQNARALIAIGAEQINQQGMQWIEVLPTCTEARNGPWFQTITRDDLETYAESIRANAGRIPIDYDHEGAMKGGSTKAAGWFNGQARVEDREDGPVLMAEVQWTPAAADAIRNGEYRFTSAEYDFAERDKATGLLTKATRIVASTLTNRPFFKQLAALAAIESDADPRLVALAEHFREEPMELFTVLADGSQPYGDVSYADPGHQEDGKSRYPLDTDEHIRASWSGVNEAKSAAKYTADQFATIKGKIRAAMTRIGADVNDSGRAAKEDDMDLSALAAALGLPEDADEPTILAKAKEAKATADAKSRRRSTGTATAADVGLFAEALGLDPGADEATVLAAVRKAAEDSDRVSSLEDEHDSLTVRARRAGTLEAEVKAIQAERRQERIARILTDAVRDGQVTPAQKGVLARQFAENPDGLLELINTVPKRSWTETGSGDGLEDSDSVRASRQQFESEEADGVDTDSLRVHVRAEQYLAERGKKPGQYTDVEYAQACDAVSLERV